MQGAILKQAANQISEPLMDGVRSAKHSISGSNAQDPEEEEEPAPPSLLDMLKNPMENCCLVVFVFGAVFGIISLVCYFLNFKSVGKRKVFMNSNFVLIFRFFRFLHVHRFGCCWNFSHNRN